MTQQLASYCARLDPQERIAKQHLATAIADQLEYACQSAGGWPDDPQPPDKLSTAMWPTGRPSDEPQLPDKQEAAGAATPKRRTGRRSVEGAFLHLHAAELMLAELFPIQEVEARIPYVLARLQTCMGRRSQLPPAIEAQFADLARRRNDKCLRAVFANAMRAAYAASDEQRMLVKDLRTILWIGVVIMAILAVSVSLVGLRWPDRISLCFEPGGEARMVCPAGLGGPFPSDVALVAFLGMLGGALSAAVAIRHLRGSTAPYGLSVALSFLKLPAGALTAVLGLLLVHGRFVPGLSDLDTSGQILAYAVVLGVAQQAATRFVDRRAREVLARTPGREPLAATTDDGAQAASPDAPLPWARWPLPPPEPGRRRSRRPPRGDRTKGDVVADQESPQGDGAAPQP